MLLETIAFIRRRVILNNLLQRCVESDNRVQPKFHKLLSSLEKSRTDDVIFFTFLGKVNA